MDSDLLLAAITNPDPNLLRDISSFIQSDPSASSALVRVISETSLSPESDGFFVSTLTFDRFRCMAPTSETLSIFFTLLDISSPTRTLYHLSRVVARHFPGSDALFQALITAPITYGRIFCLLTSVSVRCDTLPEFNLSFIEALCSPQIAVDQQEQYARALLTLQTLDGSRD
jgi:hypothetical protein